MLSSLLGEEPYFRVASFLSILPAGQDLCSFYPFVPVCEYSVYGFEDPGSDFQRLHQYF